MPDGPEDRFSKTRRQNADRRRRDKQEAEDRKRADEGKEFLCRNCRRWKPREYFEYEYDGEVRLATRCDPCRAEMREKYRRRS